MSATLFHPDIIKALKSPDNDGGIETISRSSPFIFSTIADLFEGLFQAVTGVGQNNDNIKSAIQGLMEIFGLAEKSRLRRDGSNETTDTQEQSGGWDEFKLDEAKKRMVMLCQGCALVSNKCMSRVSAWGGGSWTSFFTIEMDGSEHNAKDISHFCVVAAAHISHLAAFRFRANDNNSTPLGEHEMWRLECLTRSLLRICPAIVCVMCQFITFL